MYLMPNKSILIVEDDADIGYLLVQIIHKETPHRANHYINAGDALKAITTLTPHLFILDYSLPDMNGLELHDWLRSIDRLKHIPTILLSARNPPLEEMFVRQSSEADQEKRKELVWEIDRRLQQDGARPIIFHYKAATCLQPAVKNLTVMVNSIYNAWRFEDVWLDR